LFTFIFKILINQESILLFNKIYNLLLNDYLVNQFLFVILHFIKLIAVYVYQFVFMN